MLQTYMHACMHTGVQMHTQIIISFMSNQLKCIIPSKSLQLHCRLFEVIVHFNCEFIGHITYVLIITKSIMSIVHFLQGFGGCQEDIQPGVW